MRDTARLTFGSVFLTFSAMVAVAGGIMATWWLIEDAVLGKPVELLSAEIIGAPTQGGTVLVRRTYRAPYRSECTAARWITPTLSDELIALQPVVEVFEAGEHSTRFVLSLPENVIPGDYLYLLTLSCRLNPINLQIVRAEPVPIHINPRRVSKVRLAL